MAFLIVGFFLVFLLTSLSLSLFSLSSLSLSLSPLCFYLHHERGGEGIWGDVVGSGGSGPGAVHIGEKADEIRDSLSQDDQRGGGSPAVGSLQDPLTVGDGWTFVSLHSRRPDTVPRGGGGEDSNYVRQSDPGVD